jgi:hypothetical protein
VRRLVRICEGARAPLEPGIARPPDSEGREERNEGRADLILLMEGGQIIEQGTQEALIAARGVYHEMMLRQVESHGEESEAVRR